ncbi:MAG: polyphosphate kinase 2 family protein [Pseudorhodoplanes sp.]
MPNDLSLYRVKPGSKIRLAEIDPADKAGLIDKDDAQKQTKDHAKAIDALQDRLYAEGKRALLVVLQGTDTAGKDGTVRGVFNEAGPLGVTVTAFRRPSEEESAHDFLWRAHLACPRRGCIGIFNRSHYEDVLVGRVRKLAPAAEIEARYEQINAFEKILVENGTTILKFMLHISKAEQATRLQARLDEEKSRWKFNPGDLEDRKLWGDFQTAYEIMLQRCSTAHAPWHVIPADHKWVRNAVIARIVRMTLEEMNPRYPKPDWKPSDFKVV